VKNRSKFNATMAAAAPVVAAAFFVAACAAKKSPPPAPEAKPEPFIPLTLSIEPRTDVSALAEANYQSAKPLVKSALLYAFAADDLVNLQPHEAAFPSGVKSTDPNYRQVRLGLIASLPTSDRIVADTLIQKCSAKSEEDQPSELADASVSKSSFSIGGTECPISIRQDDSDKQVLNKALSSKDITRMNAESERSYKGEIVDLSRHARGLRVATELFLPEYKSYQAKMKAVVRHEMTGAKTDSYALGDINISGVGFEQGSQIETRGRTEILAYQTKSDFRQLARTEMTVTGLYLQPVTVFVETESRSALGPNAAPASRRVVRALINGRRLTDAEATALLQK
jgi:hypothetical protein